MNHVASLIARKGVYAMEFSVESKRRISSFSFWGGKHLVCMPVAHCGRDVPLCKSSLVLTSQLLSVIGGDATMICRGEANLDFIKALDKNPGRKGGIQCP